MEEIKSILERLTFADLELWADERVVDRGRSYLKRVSDLHRTQKGELVAWVAGTDDYATMVRLDPENMHSWYCTCPYEGGPCKHAVAVILAAAAQFKAGRELSELDEDDDLYLMLFADPGNEEELELEHPSVKLTQQVAKAGDGKIQKLLEGKSREALIDILQHLARIYPRVEQYLREGEQLACGQVESIVRALRKEIHFLTDEPAWRDHWNQEEEVPDYSHVRRQFQALFDAGHYDQLLDLGDDLWRRGSEQVATSNDDGETAENITECLEIVLKAVNQSSLSRAHQLSWIIDRMLADEFVLLQQGQVIIEDKMYTPADWLEVAATFETRLSALDTPKSANYSDTYQRNAVVSYLIDAYKRGGLSERIVPLLEREVETCCNYEKLVTHLLASGDRDGARQWCIRGFNKMIKDAPGQATHLQKQLLIMAEDEKCHDLVAAYRGQEFLRNPSVDSYKELRKSAEKIKKWPEVREKVLLFLETGRRPDLLGKKSEMVEWPLPVPEVSFPPEKNSSISFPRHSPLIAIAILEKRMDDVVRLYEGAKKNKFEGVALGEQVAEAVVKTHPNVSLSIWRGKVDRLIALVKPKAYREAAGYLRQMRKVYEVSDSVSEWQALLRELRQAHKAKRRLLEVLDALGGGTKKIAK
ncbi:MAG: SWIM zinc finger family protein [Desulfobulbus sp.]|nr:SWIM zinc finger family protein [Desulfobulbus sp.]